MQDMRALSNSRNLKSWREWEGEAYRRSGFTAILLVVTTPTAPFVVACTLYGRALRHSEPAVLTGFGLYLATSLGLMAFAMLRLNAWRRANPWTPPPPRGRGYARVNPSALQASLPTPWWTVNRPSGS
jgi:hypothetical protein